MKTKCDYKLKPESIKLVKIAAPLMLSLYAASVLLFGFAGTGVDYHLALAWSEHLAIGLRTGFGLFGLGIVILECR